MSAPPVTSIADRAAEVLGWTPTSWTEVTRGYTPAARYVVRQGEDSAFVKIATTPLTAEMLRREFVAYEAISGPFCPQVIGWRDDKIHPLLVIEDLSGADWPPPWSEQRLADTLEAIGALHACPARLPTYEAVYSERLPGWGLVAQDPQAFLSLGLVSDAWLRRALPALVEAEAACVTSGDAATHWDLRSDNICFVGRTAKLVDWAGACLSNPTLDLGAWLPSLAFEGGPAPDDILPGVPDVAAWVSGFFAARAGLPDIPDAPFVRRVQREQLSTALPWAQRVLRLPPT